MSPKYPAFGNGAYFGLRQQQNQMKTYADMEPEMVKTIDRALRAAIQKHTFTSGCTPRDCILGTIRGLGFGVVDKTKLGRIWMGGKLVAGPLWVKRHVATVESSAFLSSKSSMGNRANVILLKKGCPRRSSSCGDIFEVPELQQLRR